MTQGARWEVAEPVLSDGVVVLRPLTRADAAAFHAGEDEEQRRWFEFPRPGSVEGVAAAIERWQESWRAGGPVRYFGVWEAATAQLAGGVEARDRGDGRANVSYVVFPDFRRRGFATRAVLVLCAYAASALPVQAAAAVIDTENEASRRVAERAGFTLEGPAEPWEYSETGAMLRYVRAFPSS